MGWFRRSRPLPGFSIGDVPIGWPGSGIVVTGAPGSGKTFFSRRIQAQAIRQGLPCLIACAKPDEADAIESLCREAGAHGRFARLRPGSPHRINLLDYLCSSPGGAASVAAQFLGRLNDVAARAEGGSDGGEKFWKIMFEQSLMCAIDLCLLACGAADLGLVRDCLLTSPASPEEAGAEAFLAGEHAGVCARMIRAARARATPATARRVTRAVQFFLLEFATIGWKARGGILSMVNSTLSRLLVEPFHSALAEKTTLTPEAIEAGRLVVALDYDLLTYDAPGRMFQLAWIMLYQGYCLRRPAGEAPYSLLCRDECAYFTHPDYDARVAAVARSQKLIHFDLFQDFDLMEAAYGGGPRAKNEAMSFWANHGVKVMFRQDNPDSCEVQSRLCGESRDVMASGGAGPCPGPEPGGSLVDSWLGVSPHLHWSEQWRRRFPPDVFSSLKTGQAVLFADGMPRRIDLRGRR